ncbi:MAG TPA: ATPase domain-containing protein [Ignavibacteriaceae bacterium]|nr:ATPase domain-containing protein [Ignavibacteriaceae bacterium]
MKKSVQLFRSGIPIVDSAWGGFYHGGTYLLVGEKKSGKTLLSLQYAVEAAKNKQVCLYFTNSRPKDLMIHAASIDIDLENYINQNTIIVVRVAQPTETTEFKSRDEFLNDYLHDIISVINQYNPARIIFDELTPYVEYENLNNLREAFGSMVETIEDMGITSLLILREPAAQSSKMIFNVLNSFATGIIQLHKSEESEDQQQPGVIDITPNIGHTEGKFKANYFIEPYKGITTDFKITKRLTRENQLPEITELIPNKTISEISPQYLVPNIYSINDFKLIVNNQIALYKTTGQKFTILSLSLNPFSQAQSKISFDQLSYSVKLAVHKKDKVCTINDKIYILITKSDDKLVDDLIAKIHQTLNGGGAANVSYLMLKVNDSMNNVEDIFKEFDGEAVRTQSNQR